MTTLNNHIAIAWEQRDYLWSKIFYDLVPKNSYRMVGSMTDNYGHAYASVVVNTYTNSGHERHLSFIELIEYCMEHACGICIVSQQDATMPDALLRYGNIWSYNEFKNLAGCANQTKEFDNAYAINPKFPFDAQISESPGITIGEPSEAYLPLYVRDILSQSILANVPGATPVYFLYAQEKYALSLSLLIRLNCEVKAETLDSLKHIVVWYMPPYLSVIIE